MFKAILALVIFSSSSAWSADICKSIFSDGIQLNSSTFDLAKQRDAKEIPFMLSRILHMSANTLNESMSHKYTLEKGEITLGHQLADGWTLEFNYKRDARTSNVAYRLEDIQVLQPNGEAIKLTKSPTSVDGGAFAKDHFTLSELSDAKIKIPLDKSTMNIEAPVVITGDLLKSVEKWIPYLEFIGRDKLRLAQEGDLSKLKSGAFVKSNLEYTREIIKKQSFKFTLLGIAMYMYLQKDEVFDFVVDKDPWMDLVKTSSFEKLSSQEQKHLVGLLKEDMNFELNDQVTIFNKKKKSSSVKSYYSDSEVLKMTNDLKQIEKKSGGATLGYVFQNGKSVGGNSQKILGLMSSASEDEIVLAFIYPATRRILIVTNTLMQEKAQESFLTLAIDGNEDRDLYIGLKNTLTNIKEK
jgi:hypothetical protein